MALLGGEAVCLAFGFEMWLAVTAVRAEDSNVAFSPLTIWYIEICLQDAVSVDREPRPVVDTPMIITVASEGSAFSHPESRPREVNEKAARR